MSLASQPQLSPQEYLAMERQAAQKHEYFGGRIFAMAGATSNHNRIVRNVLTQLDGQLRGGKCEVFPSDLRLLCPSGLMTYPDLQVICGEIEYLDDRRDTVKNPVLIVEVLSKSTERYDRGEKFQFYRAIPTLQEYVLISHRQPHLERYVRQAQGGWLLMEVKGLEATADLDAIGCRLILEQVYLNVEFHTSPPGVIHSDDEQ